MQTEKILLVESKQNKGKQLYSNEIVDDDEAVREGIKVEAEHKDLITWLKAYLKERGEFPPDETIYAQIAVHHLKEDPDYYKELAKMENKNADEHREHTPIVSQQQADFFGAEVGRKERGEKGQTDMSIEELKRHLREWGKKNAISIAEDRRNKGAQLYGSRENAGALMDLFLKKADFKNPGDEGTVGDRTFRLIRKTGRTNPEGDEQWEVEIIKQK